MNAVVQYEEPSEAALQAKDAVEKSIIAATGAEVMNPLKLAQDAIRFNTFGQQAVVQAEKAVIDSDEKLGLAGDLMKAINGQIKSSDETRKGYTTGIDTLKSYIMRLFDPAAKKFDAAKKTLQGKMDIYAADKRQREAVAAAAQRKAIEDQALALASAQQAMGDSAGADKVMEQAADHAAKVETKSVTRGAFGASVSDRGRWIGKVTSPSHFLAWLIIYQPDKLLEFLEFKTGELNKLAKKLGEMEQDVFIKMPCGPPKGFEFTREVKAGVR